MIKYIDLQKKLLEIFWLIKCKTFVGAGFKVSFLLHMLL